MAGWQIEDLKAGKAISIMGTTIVRIPGGIDEGRYLEFQHDGNTTNIWDRLIFVRTRIDEVRDDLNNASNLVACDLEGSFSECLWVLGYAAGEELKLAAESDEVEYDTDQAAVSEVLGALGPERIE